MATNVIDRLLEDLAGAKRDRSRHKQTDVKAILVSLAKQTFTDAESLIRFHETLLFLRAYPSNAKVLRQVESLLKSFGRRVSELRLADTDLSPLDDPEVSGIAGTTVTTNFSYDIVRWLVAKCPTQISIDWDWFEEEDGFGATMARFLPLLEEDALVEAHVPYREWLRRAIGGRRNLSGEIAWIIKHFEAFGIPAKERAELYDSLKLHVTWKFSSNASRTRMRLPVRKVFFHDGPLIQRRDVSRHRRLPSNGFLARPEKRFSTGRARLPPSVIASCTASLMATGGAR